MCAALRRRVVRTRGQLTPAELDDLLALAALRPPVDTRTARWFRDRVLGTTDPPEMAGGLVERAAEELITPPAERTARVREGRTRARQAADASARLRVPLVTAFAEAYPDRLREIADPPLVLWVRGVLSVLATPAVAVVGSRQATASGLAMARQLGRELAAAGLTVVSGLARGIDAAAHRGALDAGGVTIAVLGCGIDVIYPREHADMAAEIPVRGALVTEHLPGTPPLPPYFPLRNRIISGLSLAVVVVEASERSGSLITARLALEQGRDVLAVPGPVMPGRHRGCHALIKDGARVVETVRDVLEEIGWTDLPAGSAAKPLSANGLEIDLRPGEALTADALAERMGRPVAEILAALTGLELAGAVARTPGGVFLRT
jgi:DNA processing protein